MSYAEIWSRVEPLASMLMGYALGFGWVVLFIAMVKSIKRDTEK